MRKFLARLFIGDDRKMLADIVIEKTAFTKTLDLERYERDSRDLWGTIGFQFKGLRKWIEDRKALILRQNFINEDKHGLKAVLLEWEGIESYIASPVEIPNVAPVVSTAPSLKSEDEILKAFKATKK